MTRTCDPPEAPPTGTYPNPLVHAQVHAYARVPERLPQTPVPLVISDFDDVLILLRLLARGIPTALLTREQAEGLRRSLDLVEFSPRPTCAGADTLARTLIDGFAAELIDREVLVRGAQKIVGVAKWPATVIA